MSLLASSERGSKVRALFHHCRARSAGEGSFSLAATASAAAALALAAVAVHLLLPGIDLVEREAARAEEPTPGSRRACAYPEGSAGRRLGLSQGCRGACRYTAGRMRVPDPRLALRLLVCLAWLLAGDAARARTRSGGSRSRGRAPGLRPPPGHRPRRTHPRHPAPRRSPEPGALALHPGGAAQAGQRLPALPGQQHDRPLRLLRQRRGRRIRRGPGRHRLPASSAGASSPGPSCPTRPRVSRTTPSSGAAGSTTGSCRTAASCRRSAACCARRGATSARSRAASSGSAPRRTRATRPAIATRSASSSSASISRCPIPETTWC